MKNKLFLLLCFLVFCSHDMYLKLETFFLEPQQKSSIHLYNGTFDKSENIIDRDRMIDVSLTGQGQRNVLDESQWTEKDSITTLNFTSGDEGTWVAGVSTKPRQIEMDAKAFNKYLKHDGVTDLLDYREDNELLEEDAIEKYSKHVKAIFQVGDVRTSDWNTVLGYPIEFVPKRNPYETHTGDTLSVLLLRDGKPLANQLVYANFRPSLNQHSHSTEQMHSHDGDQPHSHGDENDEHAHNAKESTHGHSHDAQAQHSHDDSQNHSHAEIDEHDKTHSHDTQKNAHTHSQNDTVHRHDDTEETKDNEHEHTDGQLLRTDNDGLVNVKLSADGIWYLRTIHLVPTKEEGLTHESNWATLTFEIQHAHDTKDHSHELETEIPSYVYWIVSGLLIVGLFFWFKRKN